MMTLLFSESIPKESSLASSNEDAFSFDIVNQTFSLCDGASESFDSKSWANILVQHFVLQPEVSEEWVMECIQKYIKGLDFSNLTASQCIAFQKGSFATFIGVKREKNHINITCVGDSYIFVFTNLRNNFINIDVLDTKEVFPKPIFSENPTLLSTKVINNDFLDFDDLKNTGYYHELALDEFKDTYLVCATDAVAEYIFKYLETDGRKATFELLKSFIKEKNTQNFKEFVMNNRELNKMAVDDSTLVILKCEYVRV